MAPPPDRVQYVSGAELRVRFNDGGYARQIDDGHLNPTMLRHAHLRNPAAPGEPPCTYGQIIRYLDAMGNWVAEVHQYLRPDGTRGGSGRPDPKRLRVGSTIFVSSEGIQRQA